MALNRQEQIEKAQKIIQENIEKNKEQKAKIKALLLKENVQQRKKETRQKIILGGLLLEASKTDEKFQRVLEVLKSRITRAQDKKAFE